MIYTEPGGRMEAELARWVTENNSRLPIVAFMAGRFMDEMPGMSFGHAGTIVEGKEDTATEKIARLAEAGIVVAEEISEIPRDRQGEDRSAPGMSDGAVHRRRGRRAVAGDPELAAKLTEVCPVDIFRAGDDGRRDRRGEPRRVRAVRAVHQRRARRAPSGDQALLGRDAARLQDAGRALSQPPRAPPRQRAVALTGGVQVPRRHARRPARGMPASRSGRGERPEPGRDRDPLDDVHDSRPLPRRGSADSAWPRSRARSAPARRAA